MALVVVSLGLSLFQPSSQGQQLRSPTYMLQRIVRLRCALAHFLFAGDG